MASSSSSPSVLGKSRSGSYKQASAQDGEEQDLHELAASNDLEAVQEEVGSSKVAGACRRMVWRFLLLLTFVGTFFLGRLSTTIQFKPRPAPAAPGAPIVGSATPAPGLRVAREPTQLAGITKPPQLTVATRAPVVKPSQPWPPAPREPAPPPPQQPPPKPKPPPTPQPKPRPPPPKPKPKSKPKPPPLAAPGPPLLVNPTIRLVINSHVRYWKPLNILLQSLVSVSWTRWDDMVIFMGGSRRNIAPYKGLHTWTPQGITIVNLTLNNFDYNGLAGLYRYRDDPLVRADVYFYLHDSTKVGKSFPQVFPSLKDNFHLGEVRLPGGANSNIYHFSHAVVERYKRNYDINLTKGEAVNLELGGVNAWVRGTRHIGHFAKKVVWLRGRQGRGSADVYGTGIKRTIWWYPDYDIYKYILWGSFGDIGGDGKLRPNFR